MPIVGFTALGFLSYSTDTPLTQKEMFAPRLTGLTFTKSLENQLVSGFINGGSGKLTTVDTVSGTAEYEAVATVTSLDWMTMQLITNEFTGTTASYARVKPKQATIGSSVTSKVLDADLEGATAATVQVTLTKRITGQNQIAFSVTTDTTVAPTTSQVVLQTATSTNTSLGGSLTFNTAYAGAVVDYLVQVTETNVRTIGKESSFKALGSVSFEGEILMGGNRFPSGMGIKVPRLDLTGAFEIPVTGDLPEISINMTPVVDTGYREAIILAELPD
jgi:hypothetical protein